MLLPVVMVSCNNVMSSGGFISSGNANLPTMRGKRIAGFLTYALDAGRSLDRMSTAMGSTGAEVIGGLLIKRSRIEEHCDAFVDRLLGAVERA